MDHNEDKHINHRTAWTQEEATFLIDEWDGTFATAEVIADLLGRTITATTQRYYEIQWGHTPIEEMPFEKPDVGPKPARNATRRRNRADSVKVRVTRTTIEFELRNTCPTCHMVRPLTGECPNCD